MREIIFDTETTGLYPDSGDRIVEIACIELVNRSPTGKTFHSYFNPQCDMSAEAEEKNRLSVQFLSDKPLFAARAEEFLAFIADSPLVAHYVAFDMAFINSELARIEHPPLANKTICTLEMARKRHPGRRHSLDALCKFYDIDHSHRRFHRAMLDAKLLVQLYIELTGGRQVGMALGDGNRARHGTERAEQAGSMRHNRVTAAAANSTPQPPPMARVPRPHSASAAEKTRHQEFIITLQNPLWLRDGTDTG